MRKIKMERINQIISRINDIDVMIPLKASVVKNPSAVYLQT